MAPSHEYVPNIFLDSVFASFAPRTTLSPRLAFGVAPWTFGKEDFFVVNGYREAGCAAVEAQYEERG